MKTLYTPIICIYFWIVLTLLLLKTRYGHTFASKYNLKCQIPPKYTFSAIFFNLIKNPAWGPPSKKIWHGPPLHTNLYVFWVWESLCYNVRAIIAKHVFGEIWPKLPPIGPFIKIIYIIIIFFSLTKMGVLKYSSCFYCVFMWFWHISLWYPFEK